MGCDGWVWGSWVVVKGWKADGVVGGVRGGGGTKEGTYHLINVGNSRHIFVWSPDKESYKKIPDITSHVDFLPSSQ